MSFDERGTQLAEQSLARREASLAGLDRPQRLRAEQERARDGRPTAQRVLDRRLAEDEVGLPRLELDDVPRSRRLLRQPRDELAHRALVLEPDVGLARLRGMPAARASLLDAQRRAVSGDSVEAAARDDRLEEAEPQE